MKKISVIIPCYNVEEYIDRCVESLVLQTIGIDCLELIFVDDASTDTTVEKLSQWETRYPESILVVLCEENGRQGTARNIGLKYASASYISYVDADDWTEREMFQVLYQNAIKYGTEVTACRMGRDFGDGKLFNIIDLCHNREEVIKIHTTQDRHDLLAMKLGPVVAKLFQKSFLLEHQLTFPEGIAYEDNYFMALMGYCITSMYVSSEIYYHYFANFNSTVTSRNSFHHLERLIIEDNVYEELCRREYNEEFSEEIFGRFLHMYYLNTLHILFTRFDKLPYDILQEMHQKILNYFPDYKERRTYQQLQGMSKLFCQTFETEMTNEMWDNLAWNYRYLIEQNTKKNK